MIRTPRIVVFKTQFGLWLAGIQRHPFAVSTHPTWGEAMAQVPTYLALARVEQSAADALAAAFDREFPTRTQPKETA